MPENIEIERKFLFDGRGFDFEAHKNVEILQGYVSFEPAVRLRAQNGEYYLTVKGPGLTARREFEMPVTKEQFDFLWKKTEPETIEKTRYIIPLKCGLEAELDVYAGKLSGLMTVEVEFDSLEEAGRFLPPEWFGREITGEPAYSNAVLPRGGIPEKNS